MFVRFCVCVRARREAVEYGHKQLGISEELDSPNMRAEAYLNLARTHERLGGLERYVTVMMMLSTMSGRIPIA